MHEWTSRFPIIEMPTLLHPLFTPIRPFPKTLWVEGSEKARELLERLPDEGLAVVGTRTPDPRAVFHLQEVLRKLRGSRLIILSGLARGIDTRAHEAALANELPTIAVLGSGIRRSYPSENNRLRERILAADGLVVSEYPPEQAALPGCFIQRNRLIAGFAKATWIVQSGFRSGALNTARWARDFDRPVYATPCFPGDPSFLGNQALLAREAQPLWGPEGFAREWLDLFGKIEKNRAEGAPSTELDLFFEMEKGFNDGMELFEILECRTKRTGESIDRLLHQIENRSRLG